jgi:hypothetical protein
MARSPTRRRRIKKISDSSGGLTCGYSEVYPKNPRNVFWASALLGHSFVRTTKKHHNRWIRARQEQLEQDVEKP